MLGKHCKKFVWGGLAGMLAVGPLLFITVGMRHHPAAPAAAAKTPTGVIRVATVQPHHAPAGYARTVSQPAYLRGFYQADLMAHVAGPVKYIEKNIGDTVHEGEVLVEIDNPDLVGDVLQKQALVRQAEQDYRAAQAYVPVAQAAAQEARATLTYRHSEYLRIKALAAQDAVDKQVVDEKLRDYQAAQAAAEKAAAQLQAARVDVDVKKSRLGVAHADLDHAKAILGYTKVRAPFNGIIIARHVDPGTFVQNATTGHPTPMLSVVRTDVVTAVMYVPEKDAAYVTKHTRAVLRFDALKDRPIEARVTRLSHWLDPERGRDMRVEVDLLNVAGPNYGRAVARALSAQFAPLGANGSLEDIALQAARRDFAPKPGPLRPGMYGTMTLVLQDLGQSYLVPDGAVFTHDGQTCVLLVEDGKAHRVPVKIQADDGTQSVILRGVTQVDPHTGGKEMVWKPLTGKEQIVRSGQGEITDGQTVQSTRVDW